LGLSAKKAEKFVGGVLKCWEVGMTESQEVSSVSDEAYVVRLAEVITEGNGDCCFSGRRRSIPCSYHVEIPARQTEPEKIWRWLSGLKRKQRSVETENEAEEEQGMGRGV
jgi:hypothetical protein